MIRRMQSAPIARLSKTCQGSRMKSLRSTGQIDGGAGGAEIIGRALKEFLIGQH